MGSCRKKGLCQKLPKRSSKKPPPMLILVEGRGVFRVPTMRNPNKPNRHRTFLARDRGFSEMSMQRRRKIPGLSKEWDVDRYGTIFNTHSEWAPDLRNL